MRIFCNFIYVRIDSNAMVHHYGIDNTRPPLRAEIVTVPSNRKVRAFSFIWCLCFRNTNTVLHIPNDFIMYSFLISDSSIRIGANATKRHGLSLIFRFQQISWLTKCTCTNKWLAHTQWETESKRKKRTQTFAIFAHSDVWNGCIKYIWLKSIS